MGETFCFVMLCLLLALGILMFGISLAKKN